MVGLLARIQRQTLIITTSRAAANQWRDSVLAATRDRRLEQEVDARVGGGYHMSFTNLGTGSSHSFRVAYLELKPGELIRHTDRFDDPNLPGEMMVTIRLKAVVCGTELQIEQAGIPDAIPVEMCYLGWQESLAQLATLVEPGPNER